MSTQPISGLIYSKPYDIQHKGKDQYPVKMSLLEDKAHFFEGQVNPLHSQNLQLKQQLIYAKRIISQKTKLLKGLLPTTDKNGKSRELFMDTATLEEICVLIEEDWQDLRTSNRDLKKQIQNLNLKLQTKMDQFLRKETQLMDEIKQLGQKISLLEADKEAANEKNRANISKLVEYYQDLINSKINEINMTNKYNQTLKQSLRSLQAQMTRRTDENRQRMKILQNDYDTLNQRCEESKRLMATVFEAQMKERVEQLNRSFEAVLSGRQQQYNEELSAQKLIQDALRQEMDEKTKEIRQQTLRTLEKEKQLEISSEKRKQLQKLNEKIQSQKVRCMNEIDKLKTERAGLTEVVKQKQKQLSLITEKYQSSKQEYLRQRTKLKLQLQTTEAELMESKKENRAQKQSYQSRIINLRSQFDDQISSVNVKMKSIEDQWNEKYRRVVISNVELDAMIKDEKRKSQTMSKEVQKARAEFQQRLADQKEKINQRIESIKNEQQQRRKAIEQQHKLQKVEWERVVEGKIKQVRNQLKEQMKQLNKQIQFLKQQRAELEAIHQSDISKMAQAQLNQIKKIQEQHNIVQQELRAAALVKQQEHKNAIKHMQERIHLKDQQLQKQKEETQELIKAQKIKFQSQIESLKIGFEQEKAALNKAFNDKILDLTHSFQEKISELKSLNQTQSLSSHYESQIQQLNIQFALEKKRLEQEYKASIEQMIQQHTKVCNQIKTKMEVRVVEVEKIGQQRIDQVLKEVERIKKQHQIQLIELSRRFEDDLGGLNQLLQDEKVEHCMTRMTKQEKIDYLNSRINQMKGRHKELQEDKRRVEDQLILRQKQLRDIEERIMEIVDQRIKEIEEQKVKYKLLIEQKIEEKEAECTIRVKQAMEDNLRFSSQLHSQFERMKSLHDDQCQQWQTRYEELEYLFMERPSRPEDLSIIKQLKQAREGMERMMEAAEKRVKAANEIVRYLKLQLQNYKDTYDIFGPNGPPPQFEEQISTTKKIRLSTNITDDIHLIRRQNDSPFSNQKIQKQIRKSISIKINELPPIHKTSGDHLESKSFEVIESAQKFMESITKSNKKEPFSPMGRKRGDSIKRNRRLSTVQNFQETTIQNTDFHIVPRKISIKKNNSLIYETNK